MNGCTYEDSYSGSIKALVCKIAASVIALWLIALAEWWLLVDVSQQIDLNLRKKTVKCYIWSTALHGAETWKLRRIDHKYLESSEMWLLEKDGGDQLDWSCEKMKKYYK